MSTSGSTRGHGVVTVEDAGIVTSDTFLPKVVSINKVDKEIGVVVSTPSTNEVPIDVSKGVNGSLESVTGRGVVGGGGLSGRFAVVNVTSVDGKNVENVEVPFVSKGRVEIGTAGVKAVV